MAETMAQAIERRRREREAAENDEYAQRYGRPGASGDVQQPGGGLPGAVREAILQVDTAARSGADSLTFGGASKLAAGLDALAPVDGQSYAQRYANQLAASRARDSYDAVHRGLARDIGATGALAFSVLAGGAPAVGRRIAGAAARSLPETGAILGAGGISGLALQNFSDAAAHRLTDWRDDLGAFAGGIVGGAALPLGPGRAAAIQAATTTGVQGALRRRPPSTEDLARSSSAGRVVGAASGALGRNWSQGLPPRAKGELGAALGWARSAVNGMVREPGPKQLVRPVAGKPGTIPDGRSGTVLFEDKFGPTARLSRGQRVAQSALGRDYVVYHFLPEDVAKILSLPIGGVAPQVAKPQPTASRTLPRRGR